MMDFSGKYFLELSKEFGKAVLREVFWWRTALELPVNLELTEFTDWYASSKGESPIDQVFVCAAYSDLLAIALKAWKYEWATGYSDIFSKYVSEWALAIPGLKEVACVAWVPIGINRYFERGFNQSKTLARSVSKILEIPLYRNIHCLWSIWHQARRTKKQREASKKAFFTIPNRQSRNGGTVLLLDDVISTGSTAEQCARVLKRAGFEKVIFLALARSEA